MSLFDTVITIDPGHLVICDFCNKDWTGSEESGGAVHDGWAWCPDCLKKGNRERDMRKYKTAMWCPEGISFADWIRGLR